MNQNELIKNIFDDFELLKELKVDIKVKKNTQRIA